MKKLLLIFLNILFIASSHAVSINVEEPRTIVADKIEYDVKSETIKTSGTTKITNPMYEPKARPDGARLTIFPQVHPLAPLVLRGVARSAGGSYPRRGGS